MVLRACYFCGSPGDGLDAYPVLPDRLAPADGPGGDAETVVLCPDCHAKLERVLADALAATGTAVDEAPAPPAPSTTAESADADSSGEITFDDAEPAGGGDPTPADGGAGIGAAADADGQQATGSEDVVPDTSPDGDGPAADRAETGATGGDEADDDAGDADGDDAEEEATGADASGGLRGLGDSGTDQYRKALRLLQNREFPMDRADLIDVMSSAYDLNRQECDRLVDFAVDRGQFTDDAGVLRRD